jgi:hypothetical protein
MISHESKSERKVSFFYLNGGKWRQEKHTDTFGHQSSTFQHSFQIFSGACHNIRWYCPRPGCRRRSLAPEAISGPHSAHRTAPTRAPLGFHVFGKLKNLSETGDFHLTSPSKPRSRNHFWLQTLLIQSEKSLLQSINKDVLVLDSAFICSYTFKHSAVTTVIAFGYNYGKSNIQAPVIERGSATGQGHIATGRIRRVVLRRFQQRIRLRGSYTQEISCMKSIS